MRGGADHERVGAEFLGRGRELPGRAATPGADVHVDLGAPGDLVELGQQPALKRVCVARHAHHLPGQRLAVDPGRAHVHDEQRPAEPDGQPGRVGQGVATGCRTVVAGHDRVLEPEGGYLTLGATIMLRGRPARLTRGWLAWFRLAR
ncbi:MAG TPA: hypothetical protein VJ254_01490 [Streptosporangiaceae bacterium]|nr:hypothetical protein [Streptosporangiaceae bacterium]